MQAFFGRVPRRYSLLLAMSLLSAAFFSMTGTILLASTTRAPLPPQSASATEKREAIWNRIEASAYSEGALPSEGYGFLDLAKLVSASFLQIAFTNTSDEMPLGRKRLIHTFGAVAKVRFESDRLSPFTGLFQSGGEGLARLSLASPGGAFTPGMALKIFIDGRPSVNFHIMNSLDGQGDDRNFFANRFSNIVPTPTSVALQIGSHAFANALRGLKGAPENERILPLDEAAAFDDRGREIGSFRAPLEVEFWPTGEAAAYTPSQDDADLRERLAAVPAGTVLYEITARTRDGVHFPIGRLITESPFLASRYGDEVIFFQHQRKLR